MVETQHIGITLVEQSQAQKEVTVNEAFIRIDALLNTGAQAWGWDIPPVFPADGDIFIIGNNPQDAWEGYPRYIAYYNQIWRFIPPQEGSVLWVNDENILLVYRYGFWRRASYSPIAQETRILSVGALQMRPALANGCAPMETISLGLGKPDIHTLNFDASVMEYATASLAMPEGWNGGVLQFSCLWSYSGSVTGDVVWSVQALSSGNGASFDAVFSSAVNVVDTAISPNMMMTSAFSADVIPAGASGGPAHLHIRIGRDAANAEDTLTTDARLHGMRIAYITEGL